MWMLLAGLAGTFIVFVLPFLLIDWPISAIICVVLYFNPIRIPWLRRRTVWRKLRQRMNYEVVGADGKPPLVDQREQLVFAVAPHGAFCFSIMMTWVFDNPDSPLAQRYRTVVPLVASGLLRVPLLGLLAKMLGCESITSDNYQSHLAQHNSVAIAPGGAKEVMYCDRDDAQHITLHRRHSSRWVEYGMYNNTNIVPVLSIGETSGYRVFSSWRPLQRLSYRVAGWPFPVFNFGALYSFLPGRGHLRLVVGRKLRWNDYNTTEAMADAYYTELERLAAANNITIRYEH
jgi:hypothetical protein